MISTVLLGAALAVHPLGNFSVNHLVELSLHPDRVEAVAIVDLAELPTLQLTPSCDDYAAALTVRIDGSPLKWNVQPGQLQHSEGAAGLSTTKLTCHLSAPADLTKPASLAVENGYLPDRVGWHEITASGFHLALQTGLPSRSATDGLRTYPVDPLSSPLDVRSASFTTRPGTDATRSASEVVAGQSILQRAEAWLTRTIGDTTPIVGLLAVLAAMLLGAAHAAMPGHGKTVIAVYMAGRQGRKRDALAVGATVTLSHTAGVLVLGLGLSALATLAAESVLSWLGIVSGAIVVAVGAGMLLRELRHRRAHRHGHDHHHHDHHHHDHHHHDHHDDHHHDRKSLTALGVAGGLVPSPTALVVLLGAIALGRTWFGILLIVAYGLGMAATLTAAGLLLLRLRARWGWLARLNLPPAAIGSVIIALGLGLAARAALGL